MFLLIIITAEVYVWINVELISYIICRNMYVDSAINREMSMFSEESMFGQMIIYIFIAWFKINYSCSFIVNLGINTLKSFQLEGFFWSSNIKWLLCLYEFVCSHLSISISYFWVCFRTRLFFEVLHLPISLLKICTSCFSKVISDNSHDWSLWSICSTISKSFIGKTNSSMMSLQSWHPKRNSRVMVFSVVVELFCCYHTIDSWLFVKLLKIFRVIWICQFSCFMEFPRSSYLCSTFLICLIWSTISKTMPW